MTNSNTKLPPKPGSNYLSNAVDEASEISNKVTGFEGTGTRGGSIFDD